MTVKGFSFPPELEREIFEATASLFQGSIPTLLRVCHRVHVWIEPLLYRVVVISPYRPYERLFDLVESKTPLLQTGVRHLLIQSYHSAPNYSDLLAAKYGNLLAACFGAINLSIDGDLSIDIFRALDKMRLRKFAFTVSESFFTPEFGGFTHPLFMSITHLDLYATSGWSAHWETWSGLVSIPALTHLALAHPIAVSILSQAVAECQRLSIAVIPTYDWEQETAVSYASSLGFTDVRVVVMVLNNSYEADWELGARGADDFWIRAERFVDRKRTGEIEAGCYLLNETVAAANPS